MSCDAGSEDARWPVFSRPAEKTLITYILGRSTVKFEMKAAPKKVMAMVLAGGEGSRLRPLTLIHAKPALPFGGGFRIVDFVLSNLVNSGIDSIYLLAQYKPESLIKHIDANWNLASNGKERFVQVVLPRQGGNFRGTADAVYQNLALIE